MSCTPETLVAACMAGDRRALSRLLTWVEVGDERAAEVSAALPARPAPAHVLGITGAPGAGKSTLTNALVARLRARGQTVGVLAIDPSSPFTGGALLGDRIRMTEHTHDAGVFVRSIATRGELGGLASAVPACLRVLDSYGFDRLIVETVGVGQVEVDVVDQADTTLVVVNPGWGDGVQASKAGLIEIADVFAINKADRDGAAATEEELADALSLAHGAQWTPPIRRCCATTGDGVDTVLAAADEHDAFARASGLLEERRRARRLRELQSAVRDLTVRRIEAVMREHPVADEVASGALDPVSAARIVIDAAGVA